MIFASCSQNYLWFSLVTILSSSSMAYFLILNTLEPIRLAMGRGSVLVYILDGSKSA